MKLLFLFSLASAVATASAALPVADLKRDTPVDFAKDLYPVLKKNCLACHNTTKAKGGLNLESPAAILQGGDTGPAAVAGRSSESLLFQTASHQEDPVMPPAGNKVNAVNLTPAELALLQLWIDQGATGGGAAAAAEIVWRGFPAQAAPVSAAAVSPAGTLVAAARGNQVAVTEVATGVSLGFLSDPALAEQEMYRGRPVADRDAVMAVAFGADDVLATGGYRTTRVWRRSPLAPVRESVSLVEAAVSVSVAGTMAAAGDAAGRVWLWDTSAATPEVTELKDHAAPVRALAFSPDGRFLVSAADDRSVRVWSVSEKKSVFQAESASPVSSLVFLQSGALLAATGADGVLRVHPFTPEAPPSGVVTLREVPLGDKAPAFVASLDPAGTQVAWGTGDAVIKVLDVATGQPVRDVTCEHPNQPLIDRADRQKLAAQRQLDGRTTRVTAAMEAAKKESEAVRAAHDTMEKSRAEWQRKLAAASTAADAARSQPDDAPRKEAAQKSTAEAQTAERAFINARANAELSVRLAAQALNTHIAAEAAQTAATTSLAEAAAALEAAQKPAPFPAVRSVVVLSDRRAILLALEGGRAQWHSLETGALTDAAELTSSVMASQGGQLLAQRPDFKWVVLPEHRPWRLERTLGAFDDPSTFSDRVTSLDFSSDGRLLAVGGGIPSRGGEVTVWNVQDGSLALTLKDPHSDTVNSVAFSPDDSLLATAGSDRWARVFRVADGERVTSFEGHAGHVLSVAWRADGLALATGGADKSLRTWDVLEAKQVGNNTSFGKEVSAVGWLGAGDTVVSASGDATVRFNEDRLPGARGFAFCAATDHLGRLVAVGGEDGVLRVWMAAEKKLFREFGPVP